MMRERRKRRKRRRRRGKPNKEARYAYPAARRQKMRRSAPHDAERLRVAQRTEGRKRDGSVIIVAGERTATTVCTTMTTLRSVF